MLTWILLAIVVAALLGYINLEDWGKKGRKKIEESMPQIKKFIENAKSQLENKKDSSNKDDDNK